MSVEPPGWNGTMMRTGRLGQACAHAPEDLAASAAAPAKRRRHRRREGFIARG
jgi:hypothetical protein